MLTNIQLNWVRNYYYEGLNRNIPANIPEDLEEDIRCRFVEFFVKPVNLLLYGESRDTVEDADVTKILALLKQSNTPGRLYVLNELANKCNPYPNEREIPTSLIKMVEATEQYYAIAKDSKDVFKVYVRGTEVLGNFPVEICVLGPCRRFKDCTNLLQSLANCNPIKLSDFGIEAVRRAVEFGVLEENKLAHATYPVVENGQFVNRDLTAMCECLPSYFVRRLLSNLPEATKKDAQTVYHAALDFVEKDTSNEYKSCYPELKAIVESMNVTTTGLNDELVLQYLREKYNTNVTDLDKLLTPSRESLFTAAFLLEDEERGMTVEEYLDKTSEEQVLPATTLDELITAFCASENFDTNCTVNQLVQFINDSKPCTPAKQKTLKELAIEYKNTFKPTPSDDLTLAEFINDIPHKPVDNVTITCDTVKSCELIPSELRDIILDAVLYGKEINVDITKPIMDCDNIDDVCKEQIVEALQGKRFMYYPELSDMLQELSLPADLASAIITASVTKQPFTQPDFDLTTKLVTLGVPRVVATDITEGNYKPQEVKTDAVSYTERGYVMAEHILHTIREKIDTADSSEIRTDLLPLLYAFYRLMMVSASDFEEVKDYLNNTKTSCKPWVVAVIDETIQLGYN